MELNLWLSFYFYAFDIINSLSIQGGETKLSAIAYPGKAAYCCIATMAYPLDYFVECNNQMMVAAGGNSALRL